MKYLLLIAFFFSTTISKHKYTMKEINDLLAEAEKEYEKLPKK